MLAKRVRVHLLSGASRNEVQDILFDCVAHAPQEGLSAFLGAGASAAGAGSAQDDGKEAPAVTPAPSPSELAQQRFGDEPLAEGVY